MSLKKRGIHPPEVIAELGESLLSHLEEWPLMDPYALYQHPMDYWTQTLQDDCYLISA